MLDARTVPATKTSEKSRKELITRGWSTAKREADMVARAEAKVARAEARAQKRDATEKALDEAVAKAV